MPAWMGHLDKLAHGLLFGILALLLFRALRYSFHAPARKLAAFAFIITVLYGASDEFHQSFVEGRCMSVTDWLADTIGAACVLVISARGEYYGHSETAWEK